jgi:4a-hydroxytetrahydrobiopterin dehydratase
MAKLSESEITQHLETLSGWAYEGNAIQKTYKLQSFPAAIALVTHIAFLAEAAAHHPDIDIRFNKVMVMLSTHDVGGVSQKDFDLATQIDETML